MRSFISASLGLILLFSPAACGTHAETPVRSATPVIVVQKSPTCSCCQKWVDYMKEEGFEVEVQEVANIMDVKVQHGIPNEIAACHTSTVDGYILEGHVPAEAVRKLLAERPKIAGLSVPGMPMGSPGMEGHVKQAYKVFSFQKGGTDVSVFSEH